MTVYYSAHARPAGSAPGPGVFRILYVCVANQHRSPLAERLTRLELETLPSEEFGRWEVGSAGTRATEDRPMHRYAARALLSIGADPYGFVSRTLTAEHTATADLILTATTTERDIVIARVPTVLPVAYALKEFARLVVAVPRTALIVAKNAAENAAEGLAANTSGNTAEQAAENAAARARAIVARARKARGRVPYVEPSVDDIADPPQTVAAFERCAAEIHRAVRTILSALAASADQPVSAAR